MNEVLIATVIVHLNGSNRCLELLYLLGFLGGVIAGVLGRRK